MRLARRVFVVLCEAVRGHHFLLGTNPGGELWFVLQPSGTHGRQTDYNLASDFAFLVLMGDRLIVNTVFYACMSRSTIKFTLLPVLSIVRVITGMSKSRE